MVRKTGLCSAIVTEKAELRTGITDAVPLIQSENTVTVDLFIGRSVRFVSPGPAKRGQTLVLAWLSSDRPWACGDAGEPKQPSTRLSIIIRGGRQRSDAWRTHVYKNLLPNGGGRVPVPPATLGLRSCVSRCVLDQLAA